MSTKKTTEVEEVKDQLPSSMLADMEQDAGRGFEDTTSDDYAIPFLSVANALSKALKTSSENHIPGLKQGHIYDDVAGRFYDDVTILPVFRQRQLVEWDDRKFVSRYPYDPEMLATTTKGPKGEDLLPNGNKLVDTFYMYALVVDSDGPRPVVISFAKSGIRTYKKLMARSRRITVQGKNGPFNPPLYSHTYVLGATEATSRDGDDYWTWQLRGEPEAVTDPDLYRTAKDLHDQVSTGERTAAAPAEDNEPGNGADAI